MKNKFSPILVTFTLLTALLIAGYLTRHHPLGSPETEQSVISQTNAQSQAAMGVMSEPEALEWERTAHAIHRRKTITPSELDWLLLELPKAAPSPDPTLEATRRLELMMALNEAKTYSPTQKERIYSATVGYLAGPETNDKMGALSVMHHLREPRAIVVITPLLDDPDPRVRLTAKRTLKAIAG